MTFTVNDSPFAGREGQFTTSRQIRARLYKELESDAALRINEVEGLAGSVSWVVAGRGEHGGDGEKKRELNDSATREAEQ